VTDELTHEPVIEQRRLRARLRRARDASGYTQQRAAEELDWNRERIVRFEKGQLLPQASDVRALASLYGLPPAEVDALLGMVKVAKQPGWTTFRDLFAKEYIEYLGLEAVADRVSQYHPLIIPGLLQTEDYAAEIMAKVHGDASADRRARLLRARLLRQDILEAEQGPRFLFLLDEAALRRIVASHQVMTEQVHHLLRMQQSERITVRVLPLDRGAHPGLRGPVIHLDLTSEDFDDAVFIESPNGDSIIKDDVETATRFAAIIDELQRLTLPLDDFLEHHELAYPFAPA
jgi:transcriptional regulator with XRE-family HTH domain